MGCYFLLQGILLTQDSNPSFSHCRQTLYPLSHLLQNTVCAGRLDLLLMGDSFVWFQSKNSDPEQLPNVNQALWAVVTPPFELLSGDRHPLHRWWPVVGEAVCVQPGGGVMKVCISDFAVSLKML